MVQLWREETTHVPVLGVDVNARRWDGPPDSPPLVLVAGLGMASRYWTAMADQLAGRFWLIAPDLPGFGQTPRPRDSRWPAGPTASEQADQLLAWLDASSLERVVLVGHSTGCQTVVDLAVRRPDRVEQLILAGPPFPPGQRTFLEQVLRLTWASAYEKLSLYPIITVDYWRAGIPRIVQQAIRVMGEPLEEQLPSVVTPTLVIAGQLDPLGTLAWCERIVRLLPNGQLAVIEHTGHAMQHAAPADTAAAVEQFLSPSPVPAREDRPRSSEPG